MNTLDEGRIRNLLVERGEAIYTAPRKFAEFTKHPSADRMLNDLKAHPHAFVLGSIMDQQIKAERAWLIPFQIMEKMGDSSMDALGHDYLPIQRT